MRVLIFSAPTQPARSCSAEFTLALTIRSSHWPVGQDDISINLLPRSVRYAYRLTCSSRRAPASLDSPVPALTPTVRRPYYALSYGALSSPSSPFLEFYSHHRNRCYSRIREFSLRLATACVTSFLPFPFLAPLFSLTYLLWHIACCVARVSINDERGEKRKSIPLQRAEFVIEKISIRWL